MSKATCSTWLRASRVAGRCVVSRNAERVSSEGSAVFESLGNIFCGRADAADGVDFEGCTLVPAMTVLGFLLVAK